MNTADLFPERSRSVPVEPFCSCIFRNSAIAESPAITKLLCLYIFRDPVKLKSPGIIRFQGGSSKHISFAHARSFSFIRTKISHQLQYRKTLTHYIPLSHLNFVSIFLLRCLVCWYQIFLHQCLLSYQHRWSRSLPGSALYIKGSRTIPPVGNYTLP